ncbi:ubiquitin-activating enzyme E1 3 [Nematolebias whitei]|uniref:ubiquitin-activating enzyme E1 3 n=1 Tax=Nematolebias whitei TaxID=451745 RepID=UPI001896E320|nr:ubiquitin-activating enzyme E1 3 [Nematolebias whitei]
MTLADLIQYIKETHGLNVCSLFYGPAILYNGHEDRLKMSVSDVVKKVTKAEIPSHKKVLELIPSFDEDEDCETVPTIRYRLN